MREPANVIVVMRDPLRIAVLGLFVLGTTVLAACSGEDSSPARGSEEPTQPSTTGSTLAIAPGLVPVLDALGCDPSQTFDGFTGPIRGAVADAGVVCARDGDVLHIFLRNATPPEIWADDSLVLFGVHEGGEGTCSDWLLYNDQLVIVVAGPEAAERTRTALSGEQLDVVQSLVPPPSYVLPSRCGRSS